MISSTWGTCPGRACRRIPQSHGSARRPRSFPHLPAPEHRSVRSAGMPRELPAL